MSEEAVDSKTTTGQKKQEIISPEWYKWQNLTTTLLYILEKLHLNELFKSSSPRID